MLENVRCGRERLHDVQKFEWMKDYDTPSKCRNSQRRRKRRADLDTYSLSMSTEYKMTRKMDRY